MSADTPAVDETVETDAPEDKKAEEQDDRVPYDRFKQANDKAKAAEKRAADAERRVAEAENAGLPELERLKKENEATQKRLADAEKRAEEADKQVQHSARERWVAAAASRENFVDPDDAARYIDLDDVEDADQAERAVKKLAKSKKHLVKAEEAGQPQIGRVLEGGKPASKPTNGISPDEEAESLAAGLKQFIRS